MKTYMNVQTGETGTYDDWFYQDESGVSVSAVDTGEVSEVNNIDGEWVLC